MLDMIKEIILDFQNEVRDTGVKRHLDYERVEKKAFVCIGVRRAGKSTLLYQIISDLNLKNVKKENILYINLNDEDTILEDQYTIHVVPAWKFLIQTLPV